METQRELPKKYKKEFSHSYTLGPFPTFELLLCRPESAEAVYFEESFTERGKLSEEMCIRDRCCRLCSAGRWGSRAGKWRL